MDENKRLLFAITCCAIWLKRNKIHHQGEKLNIVGTIAFIMAYKSENDRLTAITSKSTGPVSNLGQYQVQEWSNVILMLFSTPTQIFLHQTLFSKIMKVK